MLKATSTLPFTSVGVDVDIHIRSHCHDFVSNVSILRCIITQGHLSWSIVFDTVGGPTQYCNDPPQQFGKVNFEMTVQRDLRYMKNSCTTCDALGSSTLPLFNALYIWLSNSNRCLTSGKPFAIHISCSVWRVDPEVGSSLSIGGLCRVGSVFQV